MIKRVTLLHMQRRKSLMSKLCPKIKNLHKLKLSSEQWKPKWLRSKNKSNILLTKLSRLPNRNLKTSQSFRFKRINLRNLKGTFTSPKVK